MNNNNYTTQDVFIKYRAIAVLVVFIITIFYSLSFFFIWEDTDTFATTTENPCPKELITN